MNNIFTSSPKGVSEPLYYNDSVHIIFDACKSCYNITRDMNYEEIKQYIGKRVVAGHDSILEHSNIIISISGVDMQYIGDLLNMMTAPKSPCRYLKIRKEVNVEENSFDVLIQGSIRAFKHLIINFNWNEEDNIIISHIKKCLYQCTVKEFWCNVPEDIMDPTQFVDNIFVGDEEDSDESMSSSPEEIEVSNFTNSVKKQEGDTFQIVNLDPLSAIRNMVTSQTTVNLDENEDLLELGTITILFENMSRTATHQLVRHRNAITQESQRYVDYSKAGFTAPRVDYLRDNKRFSVCLNGETKLMSLEELGQEIIGLYPQLRNHGLKKEDARAFLPGNVQCKKIYMTFTYRTLFKFFELRCEKHAQEEIREYAAEILDTLCNLQTFTPSEELKNELGEAANKLSSIYWIPGIEELRHKIRMKNEEYGYEVKE